MDPQLVLIQVCVTVIVRNSAELSEIQPPVRRVLCSELVEETDRLAVLQAAG